MRGSNIGRRGRSLGCWVYLHPHRGWPNRRASIFRGVSGPRRGERSAQCVSVARFVAQFPLAYSLQGVIMVKNMRE